MKTNPTLYVTTREAWRAWLEQYHTSQREIWLIYYKKHSGRPRIPYDHAVEEALCYGWIDSTIKRLDGDRFMQRFTPRRPGSKWSALNIGRMRKLVREGRLKPVGLAKFDQALLDGPLPVREKNVAAVPLELKAALTQNPRAAEFFASLAPSCRRQYILWISQAKRAETKARRVGEALVLLEQKQKLGMK